MNRYGFVPLVAVIIVTALSAGCARLHLALPEVAEKERQITPGPDECLIYIIREGRFYAGGVNHGFFINETMCLLNSGSFSSVVAKPGKIEAYAYQVDDLLYREILSNNSNFVGNIEIPFYEVPYHYETPEYGGVILKTLEFSVIKTGIEKSKDRVATFKNSLTGFTSFKGSVRHKNIRYLPTNDTSTVAVMRLMKNPPYIPLDFSGIVPVRGGSYNAFGTFSFLAEAGKVYFLFIKPTPERIKIDVLNEQKGRALINKLPATPYKMRRNNKFMNSYDFPEN